METNKKVAVMNKEVESMSSIKRFLTEESLSLFGDYVISSNGLKRLEYYQEFEVRKIGCNNTILYYFRQL